MTRPSLIGLSRVARGWTGTFTVEREGKTHQIRLMRTTIAVNSIDSGA